MQKEDWDDFRVVLAAARAGSFADAARILGVNESTVVRRLAQAEQRMAARLFDRHQGRLQLTDAGREFVRRAERVEAEVQEVMHTVRGADADVAGTVRLTSVPMMVNRVLVPALPALLAQHPKLEVELVAEARVLSLTKREADIALRLSRPRDEMRVVARKVGELAYAVYAPADTDAAALPWLTYEDSMSDLPQAAWISEQVARGPHRGAPVRVNDAEALLSGLAAGLGKTLLPTAVGDRAPGLVRVGERQGELTRELWLLVHPELRRLDRVRAVMDWAAETCARLTDA
jgi:DNA-binding transcriptional LysR family regulator